MSTETVAASGAAPAPTPALLPPSSTHALLSELLTLQASRAHTYRTWEEGFRIFQRSKDVVAYQALCGAMTGEFQALSARVRAVEDAFKTGVPLKPAADGAKAEAGAGADGRESAAQSDADVRLRGQLRWAGVIRALQNNEREKLNATAQLHMLHARYIVLKDDGFDEGYTEASRALRTHLHTVVAAINEAVDEVRDAVGDCGDGQ